MAGCSETRRSPHCRTVARIKTTPTENAFFGGQENPKHSFLFSQHSFSAIFWMRREGCIFLILWREMAKLVQPRWCILPVSPALPVLLNRDGFEGLEIRGGMGVVIEFLHAPWRRAVRKPAKGAKPATTHHRGCRRGTRIFPYAGFLFDVGRDFSHRCGRVRRGDFLGFWR